MSEKGSKENKLGTMPVGPLLISMAVPMMLSFFIQALYNIVDSMFVARISEEALASVSLAFPMQQIMNAIGIGTGVGISASIPRLIGQKKKMRRIQLPIRVSSCVFAMRLYLFSWDLHSRTDSI